MLNYNIRNIIYNKLFDINLLINLENHKRKFFKVLRQFTFATRLYYYSFSPQYIKYLEKNNPSYKCFIKNENWYIENYDIDYNLDFLKFFRYEMTPIQKLSKYTIPQLRHLVFLKLGKKIKKNYKKETYINILIPFVKDYNIDLEKEFLHN